MSNFQESLSRLLKDRAFTVDYIHAATEFALATDEDFEYLIKAIKKVLEVHEKESK